MNQRVIELDTQKRYSIFITLFTPITSNSKSLVISSATGVLQTYYSKFATYFCTLGFTVYTFDYSGIGLSHSKHVKTNTSNLLDWAANQALVLQYAKAQHKTHKLVLITHSIGGQLVAFNTNIKLADAIITVASQSGYWKLFCGFQKLKMFVFWNILIPITTPLFGYFPAKKLNLFENLPKLVTYQWRRWGNKKNYFLSEEKKNLLTIESITCPILVLSFTKDNFAPKPTVDWLAAQFTNATVDRRHIEPKLLNSPGAGHFGLFRARFKASLWILIAHWIEGKT